MEIGALILAGLGGFGAAMFFDWLYYKPSGSLSRALDEAQNRIDLLQTELAAARAERAAATESEPAPPLLYLETQAESSRAEADHARIEELERLLVGLREESADAEKRARLFEARLTDASSELASLRYGLPTLDRKAEDVFEEIPRA